MQKLMLVLYLASSLTLDAATIAAVELAGLSSAVIIYDSKGGALAVSWSQPYTSTNTTIEAPLTFAAMNPGAPLTAWLSRSIGPATPASDIVASSGPIFAAPHDSPLPWTTFFSGLTLDPGTYYFTIAATDNLFGWSAYNGTAVPGVVTQTAGAQVLAEYSAAPDFIASPVPNSGFVPWDPGFGDFHPLYRVSGDFDAQVPEPSAIWLVLAGAGLMCGFRRLPGRLARRP